MRKKPTSRNSGLTRREFVAAATAASAFSIVPRHVLGGLGYTAPGDKLNIAGIGVGGHGAFLIGGIGSENRDAVNVVALCDVDENWWDFGNGRLGDMGCHLLDLAFWALDLKHPLTAEAKGPRVGQQVAPKSLMARWTFAARGELPPVELTWHHGGKRSELSKEADLPDWPIAVLFVGSVAPVPFEKIQIAFIVKVRRLTFNAPLLEIGPGVRPG